MQSHKWLICLIFLTFLTLVCSYWPLQAPFEGFAGYKAASVLYVSTLEWFLQTRMWLIYVSPDLPRVFSHFGTVDSYIARQLPIAKAGVLANIGPNGTRSLGAKSGVVIASPSTSNPNYLFTWTRDASLVYKGIVDQYILGQDDTLKVLIDDFIGAQAILQQVPNPSGNVSTGGLGEPKFHISLTAFTDDWGRPQRDGPALRAVALITYADWLIANANSSQVTSELWPIIRLDLDYVANKWNTTGFDLWEEVSSASFFTSAVQHRALRQGIALAEKIGQTGITDDWTTQANNILCFMQSYWNPDSLYITSNTGGGRSGKDANSVLASIHTFDAAAGCDAATFQPCSDKALANLKVYVDAFRSIYTLNKGISSDAAVATGRYPEDVYFGGNPWYLATAAVAEQLYDALIVWKAQSFLTVTNISLAFFQQFSPSLAVGTYQSSSTTYATLTKAVQDYADGFLAINDRYTPADGSMAEQFGREDGAPLSAVHLTWSYASTLSAFAARNGTLSASWGAKGLKVPAVCESNVGPMVKATFNVVAITTWGENIFLTGSVDQLRNWSLDEAILLSPTNYPTWSVSLDIPASTVIQFKYIRKNHGVVRWEDGPNRQTTTPATGSIEFSDAWR